MGTTIVQVTPHSQASTFFQGPTGLGLTTALSVLRRGFRHKRRASARTNAEHPPLGKALAAVPLAIHGAHADYSSAAWQVSADFFPAYGAQWIFGDAVLGRWNDWKSTLLGAFSYALPDIALGWFMYRYGNRLQTPQL
jgi:hypothetical protein